MACTQDGGRPPDDLSPWLAWSMGEDRRRDPMAPALPAGSSAAIDFTAGEMTLLRALITSPPTLHRHALSREFCRPIGWFKLDSGLKDMMARVTMLTDRPATLRPNAYTGDACRGIPDPNSQRVIEGVTNDSDLQYKYYTYKDLQQIR